MIDIEKEVGRFHRETFPNATKDAIEDKVAEEVQEFFDATALNVPLKEYWSELADVVITHMVYMDRVLGLSLSDLVEWKLDINKSREWGEELENGDRPRVKG